MASGGLIAQPLGGHGSFNWVFLVELLVSGILALFFLFYFNRLFATVISYGIRAYTWHKYRAYIDITSLQISLLGGRLFFKGVRYHGHNETILVHDGHITWRYWIRQVQEASIFQEKQRAPSVRTSSDSLDLLDEKKDSTTDNLDRAETGNQKPVPQLPCRISVKISGVEAFLYNRSPAYDELIKNVIGTQGDQSKKTNPRGLDETFPLHSTHSEETTGDTILEELKTQSTGHVSSSGIEKLTEKGAERSPPSFLRFFPIQIECKRAGAAMGNENTTSVVTAKLESATGRIDVGEAGKLDLFKLLFNFDFNNVLVSLKPNNDFKMYQLQAAARRQHEDSKKKRFRVPGLGILHGLARMFRLPLHTVKPRHGKPHGSLRTASLDSLKDFSTQTPQVVPGQSQWHGLARYLDDDDTAQDEWDEVEYARLSSIADCKKISMKFYWDIPGTVPEQVNSAKLRSQFDNINGSAPPDYGLDLFVYGGVINYGPWADRHRINLQQIFFPATFVDAKPTEPVPPGQPRLATIFKLHLCIEEDITLRIPTRESSKDWRWQGRTAPQGNQGDTNPDLRKRRGRHSRRRKRNQITTGPDTRPFGWLDIKVYANSVVNYTMDMYARNDGYRNNLDLDVKGSEIASSVNHGLLWQTGKLTMEGDLSNPIQWNSLRKWLFKVDVHDLSLFILRDHMFLIIDLVADWASGAPPDFFTFVPFQYLLELNFNNFKLNLNSNDANIINNPSEFDDNNFLVLQGRRLHADLGIPIDHYRPAKTEITFDVLAHDLALELFNPPRSTLHNLLHTKRVADLSRLTLTGSHTAFAEQSPELTDLLQMNIRGSDLNLKLFGFVVRHFVNVKENYFGDFLHFRTVDEFQSGNANATSALTEEAEKFAFRRANDLDVILGIVAERPTIMLPANLYSAESYVKADFPVASADLRVTNYYLDLETNIAPISISYYESNDGADGTLSNRQLYIEKVDLSGHRLFGLPPLEPAYVSNWDVDVGIISGECSLAFVRHLAQAGRSLAFAIADNENAVPLAHIEPIPELTFLRLGLGSLAVWLETDSAAIGLFVDPAAVEFKDWADDLFSTRLTARAPNLTVACVAQQSAPHYRTVGAATPAANCLAFFQTSVDVSMVGRKEGFLQEREKQQRHLRRHDSRTNRAPALINRELLRKTDDGFDLEPASDPPAMSVPCLPTPCSSKAIPVERLAFARFGEAQLKDGPSPVALGTTVPDPLHDEEGGLSSMNLSSAFIYPDIVLNRIEVDLSEVPEFSAAPDEHGSDSDSSSINSDLANPAQDQGKAHATLTIRLLPGVRVLLKPQVTNVAFEIVSALTPKKPVDIVDAFQMDVMDNVLRALQEKAAPGGIMEMNFNVPSIDLRLLNEGNTDGDAFRDQLDVTLGYMNVSVRTRGPTIDPKAPSTLILYFLLDSVSIALSNKAGAHPTSDSAVSLDIEDVLVWMVISESHSVNVAFKLLTAFVSGIQSQYIAAVLRRGLVFGIAVGDKASTVAHETNARLRYVTHYLTKNSTATSDPPYLSRMTYIVRAFPHHFRNQDSWKIVARFRSIFETLQPEKLRDFSAHLENGCHCAEYRDEMLNKWLDWCSWDIPNLESTQIFKMLLPGRAEAPSSIGESHTQPLRLSLQTGVLRFLIGTADQSSELSLAELSVDLSVEPPTAPSGLMLVEENLRTMTVLQINTAAVLLRINWDILQLVDPVVLVLKEYVEPMVKRDTPLVDEAQASDEVSLRSEFHVVMSTNDGSIVLDTLNLKHVSSSQNLRMSLIGTTRAPAVYGKSVCMLLNAEHAITELQGPKEQIWRTDLELPSIYVDYRQLLGQNAAMINVGGSFESLSIKVEQEPLAMIAIVDKVFTDEVILLKRLYERLAHVEFTNTRPSTADQGPAQVLHVNAALLSGKFSMQAALLRALSLSISGETANLRVSPHRDEGTSVNVEMEIGPMEQCLISRDQGSKQRRATFQTPSAAASIRIESEPGSIFLSIAADVKAIILQAAAVQEVLSVLRTSEVQDVIKAVEDEISDLKLHITTMLDDHKSAGGQATVDLTKTIVYDVNATLAGLKILANAPVFEADADKAELAFGFGRVRAFVSNKSEAISEQTALPDIRAQVENIGASLSLIAGKKRKPCGHVKLGTSLQLSTDQNDKKQTVREAKLSSEMLDVNIFSETASVVVDIVTHIQKRLADVDLTREVDYLRRLRAARQERAKVRMVEDPIGDTESAQSKSDGYQLILSNYELQLSRIRLAWIVTSNTPTYGQELQNLELTLAQVQLSIKQLNVARLAIHNLQLQMVPKGNESFIRSLNSALLPEVVFTVLHESNAQGIKLALQAAGKALDLRLDSQFVAPMSAIHKSASVAMDKYRAAAVNWATSKELATGSRGSPFGNKRLRSLLVDASFAGAVVSLQGDLPRSYQTDILAAAANGGRHSDDTVSANTALKAPGIALKLEYLDDDKIVPEPTLKGELKVEASSNTMHPEMVPIVLQISDSVKEVVREAEKRSNSPAPQKAAQQSVQRKASMVHEDERPLVADPSALLGKTKFSFGLRICRQEFGLSCQPIARVNAKVQIEDIYITMNTIDTTRHGHFFAVSAVLTKFGASVQHAYSRESTFSFDVDSVVLSVMNNKHLSGSSGVSAILKIKPTRTSLNARQLQDLLLFRAIWIPDELRRTHGKESLSTESEQGEYLVEKYHQVAAAAAFPWNAIVAIEELALDLDLGQSIGRSSFSIRDVWASTQKSSSWKQDLCFGIGEVSSKSTGRMSGFIELTQLNARTSIEWSSQESGLQRAPLIHAALGFERLRAKAAFDYQPFAFADVEGFGFMMYNVRDDDERSSDRLVALLDGGRVFAFCTATSPAQAVGLYQAFDRLIQEKEIAYKQSMRDLEKHLHRQSVAQTPTAQTMRPVVRTKSKDAAPGISLHTDVVVVLRAVHVGAYPGTFFDSQILKFEASNVRAQFAVGLQRGQVHSTLGMTLGQLQVALASVKRVNIPKTLGDISIDEVITNASSAKGGVILRVPKVVASMQTWQFPDSNQIQYIFKSSFEGKVDVGWNYSRISFIRSMWDTHTRSLGSRLGKPLPESAVKITAGPDKGGQRAGSADKDGEEQGKITAVVNLPISRYEYRPLEPPIIETPQLRDMGEATPPLEWIGLNRDKLPNVIHQVVIVTLSEVAKEVEDAYGRILGSS